MSRIKKAFQIFDEDGDIDLGQGWWLVAVIVCVFFTK